MEGRAGLLDVAFYIPFVFVDEAIRSAGVLPSYQGLIPNFALTWFMALTAVFVFLAAREIFTERASVGVSLIFAFATMAWPYSKMGMELSLTLTTALAMWGFLRELRRPGEGYVIFALGLAAMLLTKVQAPIVILLFVLLAARRIAKGEMQPPSRKTIVSILVIGAAGIGLFLFGNELRYGRLLLSTSYNPSWEAIAPSPHDYFLHLLGYIVSPGKSLFLMNPPLILLFFCVLPFCKLHRWYWDVLLLFIIPQILFHAYFRTWADETWGPRRLVNLLPFAVLPMGYILESESWRTPVRLWIFRSVIAAGLAMQMLAVSMNYASYIYSLIPFGLGTQRNIVWNLSLSQPVFQGQLLASCLGHWIGRDSLRLVVPKGEASFEPEDSLPWNAPSQAEVVTARGIRNNFILNLARYDDHLDFWWVMKAVRKTEWVWWRDSYLYLVILFAVAGLLSFGLLLQGISAKLSVAAGERGEI